MFLAMHRILLLLAFATTALLRAGGLTAADLEKQVAEITAGPQLTVVHFWAPWCPNCQAEMTAAGWAKFIAANPDVKFVFLNIWTKGQDPAPKLAAAGLGSQPNLLLCTHPNASRRQEDRLNHFLGLPLTWIPSTWVFKDGKLCYALNYGEVRFDFLQRCLGDSRDKWEH